VESSFVAAAHVCALSYTALGTCTASGYFTEIGVYRDVLGMHQGERLQGVDQGGERGRL
jgi:hypothetical protein